MTTNWNLTFDIRVSRGFTQGLLVEVTINEKIKIQWLTGWMIEPRKFWLDTPKRRTLSSAVVCIANNLYQNMTSNLQYVKWLIRPGQVLSPFAAKHFSFHCINGCNKTYSSRFKDIFFELILRSTYWWSFSVRSRVDAPSQLVWLVHLLKKKKHLTCTW